MLEGLPERTDLLAGGALQGLKSPVSVVRFRPWAPLACEIVERAWTQRSPQYGRPCFAVPRRPQQRRVEITVCRLLAIGRSGCPFPRRTARPPGPRHATFLDDAPAIANVRVRVRG